MTDCRKQWLGINPLGDIYPCDRYYPDKYCAGNVRDFESIDEIFSSQGYMNYYNEVQEKYDKYCSECEIFESCRGGCNANSIELYGHAAGVDETYCIITKEIFKYVYDILRNIDVVEDTNLNPYLREYFLKNTLFSVKDIKDFLEKYNIDFDL